MKVIVKESGSLFTLKLIGDLDFANVQKMKKSLKRVLLNRKAVGIIFDFEHVYSIDSTGIEQLINYCRQADEKSLSYYLVNISPQINEVFEIFGLHMLLGSQRVNIGYEQDVLKSSGA